MFNKVLIANRGEIACRVIATCKRLGISTVAVYSDADRAARHRFAADEAVHIGGSKASDSYLLADRILEVAKATGAQAVHPGYGFLSENSGFARKCADAGIAFIGPSPAAIDAMGSKSDAKKLMEAADVSCVPGYHGDAQDEKTLSAEAEKIGFPLLIKATAGGGGKGMRIVRDLQGFIEALHGARREAKAAFGDDRVLLERFIEQPRHIEFQVFGDHHGNVVHLFERECSLQRRYQKIVEESPSPFLDPELRARMGKAAVAAAKAVEYRNAGTIEFIVSPAGEFFFMEMNTRLQVEHPVTELVTGLDLVEWQLRVAAGEPLPLAQSDIRQSGHAFEVRIYAENTNLEFLPATGRIRRFIVPGMDHVRVDTGVGDGDDIGTFYDPMIAKLCVHAQDRDDAVMNLRAVLDRTAVFGLVTNLPFLRSIARNAEFAAGAVDTGWVERNLDTLRAWPGEPTQAAQEVADGAFENSWRHNTARRRAHDAGSPWLEADGWRMQLAETATTVGDPGSACAVLVQDGEDVVVSDGDRTWEFRYNPPFASAGGAGADEAHPGAPMPGRIVAIHVKAGDSVQPGQPLLVLEAMKMEYTLQSRTSGTVEKVRYAVGDMVDAEVPLVDIT